MCRVGDIFGDTKPLHKDVKGSATDATRRCRPHGWIDVPAVDVIRELLVTRAAIDKLGARSISVDEAQQLLNNRMRSGAIPAGAGGVGSGRAAW
jgi:hypothetical protein